MSIQVGDKVRLKAWGKGEHYLTLWPHMEVEIGRETVVREIDETDDTGRVALGGYFWPLSALEPVQ